MKTYYIEIERQGYTLAVIKVEAETYQEAELKALKALHANDDISEISEESALERLQSGDIDYMIDEDGCEVDLDDLEETDEPKEIYMVKCVTEKGKERIYQHKDQESAIARARSYWNDGDSEYSKITVHEVMSTEDELNDKNCIWYSI